MSIAAVVVFVTTYAMILPAITLEKTAVCGIEEHQHSDSCYEERLVCGQEESGGHHHEESCYSTVTELTCGMEEHRHSEDKGCYDADGNLICQRQDHVHSDSCYEEVRTLTCGQEEHEGHHHTDACFEKVLVCGKEVHTHSEKCYEEDGRTDAAADSSSSARPSDPKEKGDTGNTESEASDSDAAAEEVQPGSYVPDLDPLDMETMLDSNTDFYYFHAEEEEEIPADSAEITDWKKAEQETVLASTDLVKMYLAYTIPAGSLNETNPSARYRLPENLHLSDQQIDAMNRYENGIAAGYRDYDAASDSDEKEEEKENYQRYLGAEAVEGERRPDELLKDGAREFISAVVRAENVYDDDGEYQGQDLIFTFVPYSIEKNQNTYDADQTLISAGEEITGWFACDFTLDQIDWETENDSNKEDVNKEDVNKEEISKEDAGDLREAARVIFVPENQEKDIPEISCVLRMTDEIEETGEIGEAGKTREISENGETGEIRDGASAGKKKGSHISTHVITADGEDYLITVTYGNNANLPDDVDLSVIELEQGDKEFIHYLEESAARLGKEVEDISYVRIFDISLVSKNDSDMHYQPETDVAVSIELIDADENMMENLKVLHISDNDEVDVLDSSADGNALNFLADSFSIYPIVDDDGENARIGYRFWYNDGTQDVLLSTQYFRYKDVHPASGDALTINEPSIPGIESSTWNRIFRGWSTTSFNDSDSNLKTVETLNNELSAKAETDYAEGTFIDVYANLKDVYYVTYVDVNPNNILATEIVPLAESGATTFTVKPESQLRPTIDSDTVLQGWYDINNPGTVYTPGQENVEISSSLTLYPKIEGGAWLIFNDNDPVWDQEKQEYVSGGASFTPPAFYLDEVTQEPSDPTWAGYEFGGWYTDEAGTTPFEFGNTLDHDTTVYAKWIPSDSQYRVIIWKQRTSNSAGLPDDEKTYDYVTSYLIDQNVSTGDIVTLANSYKNIYGSNGTSTDTDKAYFIYNDGKTDQSVVVKADGSSVLNVYYDRKPVNLDYYTWDYGYTATTGNNGTQYGLVNGEYVQLTRNGNTWTYVAGTEYTYTRYTGTTSGDYYIPDGNGGYTQVYLYRYNNRWYRERTWSLFGGYSYSNEYTGNVYTRSETNITETYTGTRYTRNNNRSWQLYKSFTGLYGSTLSENGYTWPEEYDWYSTGGNNGSTGGTRTTFMSAFLPTDVSTSGNTVTVNFYGASVSGSYHIHFLVQNLDGTYTERDNVAASGRSFYISDKYTGYHAYQYRADNGSWNSVGNKNNNGYYNNGNTVSFSNNLYIRFNLNDRVLTFYTNNGANQMINHTLPYSKPLSEYAGQNEGQKNGYYFLGWYADPSCTEPFDFNETMPDNNVAVYGKWRKERFRIVVDPGANNVYMGSQATRFRLDYDETMDGGLMESATRAGYILDGWYTDPDFTNRFLFSNPVNSSTPGVDMTYQTSPAWAAARAAYGDDDEEHENVRGILHLYAKWIPDPNSIGINVVYDAGDAALYDSLGGLVTTVPVDTHMYGFDGTATGRESPSNYNDLYTFKYWEATKEDGTKVTIYPGDPINLADLTFSDPVYDENGDLLRKTVTLRAVYDQTGDPSRITHITYNGDTISYTKYGTSETQVLQGKTRDGTNQVTVTLNEEVNETIVLPNENDFYLNGYTLVGWSFFEGSYEEQTAALAAYNAANPDNLLTNFDCGQEVAADNLDQGPVNDHGNTLYAMWQPKEYTVTVRQVVESGVPQNTFTYTYKTGEEALIGTAAETVTSLTGNDSFSTDDLEYYDRTGDVIRITAPDIPSGATYSVRVNAVVTKDDGTTEILNPTAAGDYQILGDVVITYTYSLNVPVKFQKRDATDHSTVLSDAVFTVTPVEFNSTTQHWEIAGSGQNLTVDSAALEKYLQEGTYRIEEITAPDNYAKIEPNLYLTVKKDEPFSLFAENGSAISASIAELDSSGKILTVYDNPIRKVTLSKTVEGESEEGFSFKITVYNDSDGRLGNYVIGTAGGSNLTTNNIGEATVILSNGESVDLKIPHGFKLTVEEVQDSRYKASYVWNSEPSVDSLVFGSEPVSITADSTLAYTNTPSSQKLRIHKIGDDATSGLAGAKFNLTAAAGTDGFDNLTSLDGTSVPADLGYLPGNDSADTTLFLLPVGTYTLSETDAPDYYNGLSGDVTLTVTSEGITMSKGADSDAVELSEPDQGVYTLTVTNIRKLATVTVIKNVVGTDADKEKAYSFTQTGLTGGAAFDLRGSDDQTTEGIVENQTVFENIPFGTVFSITEANTYTDFDTTIMISSEDPAVTTTRLATGNVTVDSEVVTITYTNTRNNQPIKVFKYETGTTPEHPLANAVFSLTGPEGSGISYTGLTTNADGYLVNGEGIIFKLPVNNGAYMLTETQAPAGYQIIGEGKTTFTVAAASVTGAIAETQKVGEAEVPTGVYVIKVQNSAGAELPYTGGPGTTLIYLMGIMLTGLAGAGLVMRLRRNDTT